MKKTISLYDFEDVFNKSYNYKDNFSYEGKKALFEYLEQYEEDTGQEIELDIVALCCEYSEYNNLEEIQKNYNGIKRIEDLEDHTTVIPIENDKGFIILDF